MKGLPFSLVPDPPFGIDVGEICSVLITTRKATTLPMTNEQEEKLFANPSQRLEELCEELCQGNLHLCHLIEEVHRTLEQLAPADTVQMDDRCLGLAAPEHIHLDEGSEPEGLMVDEDHRLTYGTNRLRAGAGACELVCSQAMLYELGCLLVRHARHCQANQQPDG